jgi:chondroitin 4-sulfotransferase 11
MLFSNKHRVLFIHVSRTGGTTIRELLRACMSDSVGGLRSKQLSQHATANEIAAAFGTDFHAYFRFAFVRNPWDRLWSWYSLRRSATGDTQMTFDAFLNIWIPPHGPLVLSSQTDSLYSSSGELLVDALGRYENFASDLKAIFKQAELPLLSEIPCLNASEADHYSRFYSEYGRDLVERAYRADLENFDYRYEPN